MCWLQKCNVLWSPSWEDESAYLMITRGGDSNMMTRVESTQHTCASHIILSFLSKPVDAVFASISHPIHGHF